MAITSVVIQGKLHLYGLSTDTKTTGVPIGSEFHETDTLVTYECYDGSNYSQKKSSLTSADLLTIANSVKDVDFGSLTEADFKAQCLLALADYAPALASVLGALDDAAASGAVTSTDNVMKYLKQLVTNNYEYAAGKMQVFSTTIDLHQAAGAYDLATGTGQEVGIDSVVLVVPNLDLSDDAALTGISIQTDNVTAQTLISSTDGAKANLTAESQVASSLSAPVILAVGEKVQLTIIGGTATADPTTCKVRIYYRANVAGGYLA